MSFNPPIGGALNNHWESNWEPTSKFGARCRVEIDIENDTPKITLVTQTALSHLMESVSKFIPIERLRNWTRKFAEPSHTVITEQVIDPNQAEKIKFIIQENLQGEPIEGLQLDLHKNLSYKTKEEIPNALHNIFQEYVSRQSQKPRRRDTTFANDFFESAVQTSSTTKNQDDSIKIPNKDDTDFDEWSEDDDIKVPKKEVTIEETITKNEFVIKEELYFTQTFTSNDEEPFAKEKDNSSSASSDAFEEESPPTFEEDTLPVKEEVLRPPTPTPILPLPPAHLTSPRIGEKQSESDSSLVSGSESDVDEEPEIEIQNQTELKSDSKDDSSEVQAESTAEEVDENEPPSIEEIPENLVSETSESTALSSSSSESTDSDESSVAKEVITYSYEEIKMEASPDAVAKKVTQRVNQECDKVRKLINDYRKRLEVLSDEYRSANFDTVSAKLNEIEANLEAISTVHVVRWMGMKYPTSLAKLNTEQLLAFEAEATAKIKSVEKAMLSDQFGIKRLTKAMAKYKISVEESKVLLTNLDEEKKPLSFRDANTKKLITQLSSLLNETIKRQKNEMVALFKESGKAATLLTVVDTIETLTEELSHQVEMSKQSLEDEKFLETLRKKTAEKQSTGPFKTQFVENVKLSISAFEKELKQNIEIEISGQLSALGNVLSDNFKREIRKLIVDIKPALDVFKKETYPFPAGILSFITGIAETPLKDASGFQLVQYRREAMAAMGTVRDRLRPYQEALTRAVGAKKLLHESLEIAVQWTTVENDSSIALLHLQQQYNDCLNLQNNLKTCETIDELLEFAETLKIASGKLLNAVEDIFNEKTSTKSLKKKIAQAELSSVTTTDEMVSLMLENTQKKIEAYKSLLDDPVISKRLTEKAKEALTIEIGKFAASAPQPSVVQTPEAKDAYQKKVKLWGLTALSNLENRCHLIAFKESLLNYESLVLETNQWRPSSETERTSLPLQLSRCLTMQNQAIETATKRISGGNGVAQAVKAISDSIAAIESTQKLVVAIWEDVRGEVAGLLQILEEKKGEINALEAAALTPKFKEQLIGFIDKKITQVTPYYTSLPPKGFFTLTWDVPFDNMDEKSMIVYRLAVDQLKTSVLEEVENTLQLEKINEANANYAQVMNACSRWVEYLEDKENDYVLAAYVQAAIDKQKAIYASVAENINNVAGLTDYCNAVGNITAVLAETINVVDARVVPEKQLSYFEQFKIIENEYINRTPQIIVPQYEKLRKMLLSDAAEKLDACIAYTNQRYNEVEKASKDGWKNETTRLESLKNEFTPPGGITGMLKGLIFSQAIPVDKLNSDQMDGYLKEVYDTHRRLIKR